MTRFCRSASISISTYNKGPTIWLLRGAKGMGDFRNKYPADWFRGKKSCKVIPKEKILALKKYLSWPIMLGKKSYTVVCQEKDSNSRGLGRKKILPKPNHPYKPPPIPTSSEIKWSAPKRLPYYWDPRLLQHWLKKKLYLHFILIIIRKIEESASKQAIVVLIKIRFAFTVFYFLFNKSNLFLAAFYGRSLG